jgi:predicted CoA-substrate-specific enzyme activase
MDKHIYRLGVDLGSISLKVALLDSKGTVVFSDWRRVGGAPLEELSRLLGEVCERFPNSNINGIGVTGSGRKLVADAVGAKAINEISAHAEAAAALIPEARTIIEIGGQDSKLVILGDSGVEDFKMNELCAAGTGAFLDQQAARLGLSIEEFAQLAKDSTSPVSIAGRCAVFAKTDMTHHQQEGKALPDIVAGLNDALVRSYLANLVRGKKLPKPVAFQGGVASNEGLVGSFRKILSLEENDLVVPEHHRVMGAIGAALGVEHEEDAKTVSMGWLVESFEEYRRSHSAHLEEEEEILSQLLPPSGTRLEFDCSSLKLDGSYLGIDVGSVSVKTVLLDQNGIVFSDYRFSNGRPRDVLQEILNNMKEEQGDLDIRGIGVTGSGRHFVSKLVDAKVVKNEISAQVVAACSIMPDVDTIFEIGGQDAKFIRVEGGRASIFSMNRVCAAGTGAFLQEQADRLKIDLKSEFQGHAFDSMRPAALGPRCTVFMESDLVSHQQRGYAKCDLVAGLAVSVIKNYFEKVVGGHSIGERVLFLGGVAENKAVVAAMEDELGKDLATSDMGTLSGAIGVALIAAEEMKSKTSSETQARVAKSYLNERTKLLDGGNEVGQPTVGIPRALMTFDKLPAWRAFFTALGCRVVVSPPTNEDMLKEGMKHLAVETCLPAKAICAHVRWLQDFGDVDYIFIPSIVYTGQDKHKRHTIHCPYIQGAVQLVRNAVDTPLINPVMSWIWHPRDEERVMSRCAEELGRSRQDGRRAWQKACSADTEFRFKLRGFGDDVMARLEKGELKRAFVLLGKDYNVGDPMLNSSVVDALENKGETVITQDMLVSEDGSYPDGYWEMYWPHGKEILAAASVAARTAGLYPIFVTSFGCGPDSFTIDSARDILGEKHMLVLDVDEHSSTVGVETRLEAFLDSLPKDGAVTHKSERRVVGSRSDITKVFIHDFSDHGYAFAATIRLMGLEPVFSGGPDEEAEKLGAANASSGECHPYVLMLGDYIRTVQKGGDFTGACYFMPDAKDCRMGQFGRHMRLVAEKLGSALPVISTINDLKPSLPNPSIRTGVKTMITYWEMMRGMDFLMQKYLETRAYEKVAGSTDRAYAHGKKLLMDCIMSNDPHAGLEKALAELKGVEVDRNQKRVKIGITGDYYTRVCDYANGNIFREIERLGGVVMLPPTMTEFFKYDAYNRLKSTVNHRSWKGLVRALAVRSFVERRENRVREIFGDDLDYGVPLKFKKQMDLVKPYINFKVANGLVGSVGAIMEQIKAGANGILSLITFHCTFGLVINAALKSINKDYPHIPSLALIFEGLKPTHNFTRLEAFMEQVHN